jgi:hypothetical protein
MKSVVEAGLKAGESYSPKEVPNVNPTTKLGNTVLPISEITQASERNNSAAIGRGAATIDQLPTNPRQNSVNNDLSKSTKDIYETHKQQEKTVAKERERLKNRDSNVKANLKPQQKTRTLKAELIIDNVEKNKHIETQYATINNLEEQLRNKNEENQNTTSNNIAIGLGTGLVAAAIYKTLEIIAENPTALEAPTKEPFSEASIVEKNTKDEK